MRRRVGGERQLTARFQALVSHYLFEPCFARPGEGPDKGSVESRGTARLFAKLLSVVTDHGSEEVASALEEALAAGRFDLLGLVERSSAPRMEVPETLRRHEIESARAADFDVLLQEAAS